MKLRHVFSAVCLSLGLSTAAEAASYKLTEILNYDDNGFWSSMIHDQSCGAMCGNIDANFSTAITDGRYNSSTGAIRFKGSVSGPGGAADFEATGDLDASTTRTNGLSGFIDFAFSNTSFGAQLLRFEFADQTFTSGGEPNGLASDNGKDFIALWGDTGMFMQNGCDQNVCLGVDLRIAYEVAPVPLPASFLFLLAGVGGLGLTRRLRKSA